MNEEEPKKRNEIAKCLLSIHPNEARRAWMFHNQLENQREVGRKDAMRINLLPFTTIQLLFKIVDDLFTV